MSARSAILEAGQLSRHDAYLIHGSAANGCNRRRAGFLARYMPASSHYDCTLKVGEVSHSVPTKFAEPPIYLLRGQDRTGKTHLVDLTRSA